ncbi:MAG: metal-dependent transcriptional regulator [Anaerolineae bacterium]|nr:metal-dependent transcriptional regulator [Anaerolineae bacterium]
MQNKAIEDYLQAIYEIEAEHERVSTTALAEWIGVKPASATAMLKKLSDMGLVMYEPYQGAVLSEKGKTHALEIIRHHQLLELFLAEVLDVPWDRVYEEAHRIEHALSEYIETRIDEVLGHPTKCPHGTPIPSADGTVVPRSWVRLADLHTGQTAIVSRVSDYDAELLRHLSTLHIVPQTTLTVTAVAPFEGPVTVRIGEEEQVIGHQVAKHIFVEDMHEKPEEH